GFAANLPAVLGGTKPVLSAVRLVRPAGPRRSPVAAAVGAAILPQRVRKDVLAAADQPGGDEGGWHQWGQVDQPQTGRLARVMTELPWLDDLIRFPVRRGDTTDGVLQCDAGDGVVHEA